MQTCRTVRRHFLLVALVTLAAIGSSLPATAADETLADREQAAIRAAVQRVAPSVVRIETVGGLERVGKMLVGTAATTGLVVSSDGYIVSSAFNFVQKPDSILVTLPGGKRQAAELVATDHSRLLVLLKVETDEPLAVPEFAPQGEIQVGQWAIAVGRVFEADVPNVSVGVVSAVGRIWGKAIQTDAKISPNNYGGPLVDISGRVLGVLVPMSPQGGGELAGVEWYDSGIGFAVPLETVLRMLPQWREGKDLHTGLLGISFKDNTLYGVSPVIATARSTAPAFKAGFRAGDKVVEVDGQPIEHLAQLKHILGPRYAGEKVHVVALRGDERIDRELELTDKIEPYVAPFLGILPLRSSDDEKAAGVTIRYVYPGSPAQTIGLKPGDRITKCAGEDVANAAALVEKMQTLAPGETIDLEARRGEETLLLKPELATLPETVPGELPPAYAAEEDAAPAGDRPKVGVIEMKLPEFENECLAYVPESYDAARPPGVVVWLHAPGGLAQDETLARWKPLCEQYGLILLAPKSLDRTQWKPTEMQFIRRVLDQTMKSYAVDPSRVAVHGHQGGGTLAYLFGFTNRNLVRAVAVVDAPLPRLARLPEPELERLAFYSAGASKSEQSLPIESGVKQLREAKYPVVTIDVGEQARYLTGEELAGLVRWIDSLDRI